MRNSIRKKLDGKGVIAKRDEPAAMKIEQWPITRPIPYARNARKIPQSAVDKVAASIKEFGWQQPIVVDAEGVIVAGHTRLLAAHKLELDKVPVHAAKNLTPAQVKAYRIMDNRSHDEAKWDLEMLIPEMAELEAMSVDLLLTGFEPGEITGQGQAAGQAAESNGGTAMMGSLEYRVIVDCDSEAHQAELLQTFESQHLKCRPLIS